MGMGIYTDPELASAPTVQLQRCKLVFGLTFNCYVVAMVKSVVGTQPHSECNNQ